MWSAEHDCDTHCDLHPIGWKQFRFSFEMCHNSIRFDFIIGSLLGNTNNLKNIVNDASKSAILACHKKIYGILLLSQLFDLFYPLLSSAMIPRIEMLTCSPSKYLQKKHSFFSSSFSFLLDFFKKQKEHCYELTIQNCIVCSECVPVSTAKVWENW